MHPAVRAVFGLICGALVAFLLVGGIEALGRSVYPPPMGVDLSQPAQLQAYMQKLPLGALLFVLTAWIVATFVGAIVAAAVAGRRAVFVAGMVGLLVLIATAANFVLVPHPTWLVVAGLAGIVVAALAAGKLMKRRRSAA